MGIGELTGTKISIVFSVFKGYNVQVETQTGITVLSVPKGMPYSGENHEL